MCSETFAWPSNNTQTIFVNLPSRNCSQCKKLPELKEVARNVKSCQKVGEQLVDSPILRHKGNSVSQLKRGILFNNPSRRIYKEN